MIVIIDRQQVVILNPFGYLLALLPCRGVREAEVDTQVDAGNDHCLSGRREATVGPRFLDGERRIARDVEGNVVPSEEQFERLRNRARNVVRTRGVVRIGPYQAPGRLADADLALKRLVAQRKDTMDSIQLAEVYAFRGMSDKAFAALQEQNEVLKYAKDLGRPRIWDFQREMRVSPFLKRLHADPRWEALMARPG
jgi:hypothetical protein